MISIICPNKNSEYFQEAIESIMHQTYKDWELIVVLDNCSKEWMKNNTTYIGLLQLHRKTKVIFKEDNNPSIPSARNAGLKRANGEWIAYLSADDIWHTNFLERMIEEADKTKEMVLYSDYNRINSKGEMIGINRETMLDREDTIMQLFRRCSMNISTMMINRKVFDKVGQFDEEILYGEDYLFYLMAIKHFNFVHIPELLIDYRIHPKQMTQDNRNVEFDVIIRDKARRYWDVK